jgi:ubiquinone/menaquinone biosynthesis C-methylase UbiE
MNMVNYFQSMGPAYAKAGLEKTAGLRYLSQLETDFIQKHICRNTRVLDLGLGTGRITSALLHNNNRVTGTDAADSMLQHCTRVFTDAIKSQKLKLIKHRLDAPLPFTNGTFGQVTIIRVLKYITAWEQCLNEISRVTSRQGSVIVEFPNISSYEPVSILINRLFGIRYRAFSKDRIKSIFVHNGFTLTDEFCGTKLPHFVYRYADSESVLGIITGIETGLRNIFGNRFCRNYILVFRRKL